MNPISTTAEIEPIAGAIASMYTINENSSKMGEDEWSKKSFNMKYNVKGKNIKNKNSHNSHLLEQKWKM